MTVQIEIDDRIVSKVDAVSSDRNAFFERAVLRELGRGIESEPAEIDHRIAEAYTRQPQQPEEWEIWQDEQVWED